MGPPEARFGLGAETIEAFTHIDRLRTAECGRKEASSASTDLQYREHQVEGLRIEAAHDPDSGSGTQHNLNRSGPGIGSRRPENADWQKRRSTDQFDDEAGSVRSAPTRAQRHVGPTPAARTEMSEFKALP